MYPVLTDGQLGEHHLRLRRHLVSLRRVLGHHPPQLEPGQGHHGNGVGPPHVPGAGGDSIVRWSHRYVRVRPGPHKSAGFPRNKSGVSGF